MILIWTIRLSRRHELKSTHLAFFIVVDKKDSGFDTMVNGKFLSKEAESLRKISKALGIKELEDFVSYSPDEARELMEDIGLEEEDIKGVSVPNLKWHEPQEGLDWVKAVAKHIKANPKAVKNAKGVFEDLKEYEVVLAKAKAVGVKWNLQVDL